LTDRVTKVPGTVSESTRSLLFDALNSMEEGLVVYDADGCLQACNQAFLDMYGYAADEAVPGVHYRELGEIDILRGNVVVGDEEGGDYLERKTEYRKTLIGSFTIKLQDGRWIRTTDRVMPDGGFVSVHVDVTDLKLAQENMRNAQAEAKRHESELARLNDNLEQQVSERTSELEVARMAAERLARTDSLTSLKNRRAFFESSVSIHNSSVRFNRPYAVIMIDIDEFKAVNDSYGHLMGDKVVCALAQTLEKLSRNVDVAGRIGGDEFAIVLPESSAQEVIGLAERVRKQFSSIRIPYRKQEYSFTVSIGIAESLASDTRIEEALSRADNALYQAKSSGRNRVMLWEAPQDF